MRVQDRRQVHVRLQSREPVEHARRTVQRQSWLSSGTVEPHAEQPVQVDAVIGVLVSDGNGVQDTIWPMRKQPRKRRVAEIQGQAVAVPVHCKAAARAARLWECATAAEHGDLPHSYRMADRPGQFPDLPAGDPAPCPRLYLVFPAPLSDLADTPEASRRWPPPLSQRTSNTSNMSIPAAGITICDW